MNKAAALDHVKALLPEKRYNHTLGVVKTAGELAKRYGADVDRAELAAIYHDIAKYFQKETLYEFISNHPEISNEFLNYHESLWHAPVGALYVSEKHGILDQDVLNAITYHTTGRKGMSRLEKVVFLADYIEPGRDFPGVDEVRSLAEEELDLAVAKALAKTIQFLVGKYQQVYPDTIQAYNDLIISTRSRLNEKH